MPGFKFCPWCSGKGCIACDAEERKYVAKATAASPSWRPPDIRDVRDQALRDETKRLETMIGVTIGSQEEFNRVEAAAHAEIEEAFKPALDAEYARQFPKGPQSAFTITRSNPDDMDLLRKAIGGPALKEMFAGGITAEATAEMTRRLDQARTIQAVRKALCPNEADLAEEVQP